MINKNRVREARFFAKKPQIQLWIETGIHFSTISRIECGYLIPTDKQKKELARALNADLDWLFPKTSKKSENNKKALEFSKETARLQDRE